MKKLGWVLSNTEDGVLVIQKDDESNRFLGDDEATRFVVQSYFKLLSDCKEVIECHRCGEIPGLDSDVLKEINKNIAEAEGLK